MNLHIDGQFCTARLGQTLLDLVKELGLDNAKLSSRPLAAKIAGEVFNLNYIPVRDKEMAPDRPSIRRAMAASGGNIQLLRYDDPSGRDAYARTVQFVLFLAIRQLWPNARAKMNCTVGQALFVEVFDAEDFSAQKLKKQVLELQKTDIPLIRCRVSLDAAKNMFRESGQTDKARLLQWRDEPYFDLYSYGTFSDYFYGELLPST